MSASETQVVAHATFWYTKPDGTYTIAMRGESIEVGGADLERGKRFGAFTIENAEPEQVGSLPDFPTEGTEVEHDSWVRSAKVQEVLDWGSEHPGDVALLLAAEERRGSDARKTALEGLALLAAAPPA